jgi:DegV family protein with EDD domain
MAVKIITDSTSDLSAEVAEILGITVVPLHIHFGNETYKDGVDISTDEFYRRLTENKIYPSTSAPPPKEFMKAFDKAAEEAEEIVVLTISSRLSATYQSALKAKEAWEGKAKLEVVDSRSAIMGLGLIAIAAAKAAAAGGTLEAVRQVVNSCIRRVDFRMVFDTLEYLRRGGRIGSAQVFLGSMLKINPVITLRDGTTEAVTRLRSREKSLDYLVEYGSGFNEIEEMAIEYATTPDEAEMIASRLAQYYPSEKIYRLQVSPVIGTNVGPRVLGVGVLPKVKLEAEEK